MRYTPNYRGEDQSLSAELLVISQALGELSEHILDERHGAPDKLRIGMFRYADGSDWDPGDGEGFYGYTSYGWSLMASSASPGGGTEFLTISEFDDTDGTYYFYGGKDLVLDWKINRFHKTTFVKESADEVGNPTETSLAEAWPDRLTLSYS